MPSSTLACAPNDLPLPGGRSESASEAVFLAVLRGLESQRFVPGQRLVEADLVAQLGVGRNSVREAFQRLAAEGMIELSRHRGASVRILELQETLDVLDVAERMTGLLARSAARAAAAGGNGAAVTEALKQLRISDASRDDEGFARARRDFYRALLDLGGSRELRRLFPTIHMPIVHAQHRVPTLQKLRLRDYRAMARAIMRGDPNAADQEGMAHVQNVRGEILKLVASKPPHGKAASGSRMP